MGTAFGTEKRMIMITPRALCGLKSSGSAWSVKLAEILMSLG